jgi:serine phosphatase RsbU (regulator of sigma subunit)
LIELVARLRGSSAREILDRILDEIRSFSHRTHQGDDLTLMGAKFVRDPVIEPRIDGESARSEAQS